MNRKYYKSEKSKLNDKTVYVVTVDNTRIDFEIYSKEKQIKIYMNGEMYYQSFDPIINFNYSINSTNYQFELECKKHNATSSQYNYNEVSIKINGIPVENTLADPLVMVQKGKFALIGFSILLLLKVFISPIMYKSGYVVGLIINSLIYGIPALILIISTVLYNGHFKRYLVIGIIIGCLETLDYFLGFVFNPQQFNNVVSLIIWTAIRISLLSVMINSFKNLKKV